MEKVHIEHAALWTGTAESLIDLNPVGFKYTNATCLGDGVQGGYGWGPLTGNAMHALLWSGTAASFVDINPAGYGGSLLDNMEGDSLVGSAYAVDGRHAGLWLGPAHSFVDLHPSGFLSSAALGISGNTQVGVGEFAPDRYRPLLWHGTAASVVDLGTSDYLTSYCQDVSGGIQVGFGYSSLPGGRSHALLWRGSAESLVDLTPPERGFTDGEAYGIKGNWIGGTAIGSLTLGGIHAVCWNATDYSAIDLHRFLGGLTYNGTPIAFEYSHGVDVGANGSVVGYVSTSFQGAPLDYAIVWTPTTEQWIAPSSFSLYRGALLGGTVRHLENTDFQTLNLRPAVARNVREDQLQVILDGTSPLQSPSEFKFGVVASPTGTGMQQSIHLYNWSTGSYEVVDQRILAPSAWPGMALITPPGNVSRFIQAGTKAVRAKVSYRPTGVNPADIKVDQAVWRITP